MAAIEFTTERLILRRWTYEDRAPFAEMNADPEVMRYFPATLNREESDDLVDRIENEIENRGFGGWALQLRSTGELIGFTGLSVPDLNEPFMPAVEVGWRLKRSAWGHGYATEAARRSSELAFEKFGLKEIVSITSALNGPSMAVMERIGMERDVGCDFEHPRVPEGNPLRPHVVYRLPRSLWSRQLG